jgi:UDP-glucuronate 4-epimerase
VKVLVTGGAGFIGSHAVAALVERGDDVVVLDNFDPYYDPAIKRSKLNPAATLVEGDLRDPASVSKALEGVDAVLHLAARAGVRASIEHPGLYVDNNVNGTQQLLDGMAAAGVKTLVYASSSSVYGARTDGPFHEDDPLRHPESPYAATKAAGELLCHAASRTANLRVTCCRLFTVYGPGQRPEMAIHLFARRALAGQSIPRFGAGLSSRDYTFVADIVRGLLAALDRPVPWRVVNLGSAAPVTLNGLLDAIGQSFGVPIRIDQLPDQPGDVPSTWADTARAKAELGWEPRVSLGDGLITFRQWLVGQGD